MVRPLFTLGDYDSSVIFSLVFQGQDYPEYCRMEVAQPRGNKNSHKHYRKRGTLCFLSKMVNGWDNSMLSK